MTTRTAPRWRARLAAIAIALVGAVGYTSAVATPAHAALCGLNQFGIFDQVNFIGNSYCWTTTGMYNGQCTEIGSPWDNRARSATNNVTNWYTVRLWTGHGCTGLVISTMWQGNGTAGASCDNFNWVPLHSPCASPTASSFRYYY